MNLKELIISGEVNLFDSYRSIDVLKGRYDSFSKDDYFACNIEETNCYFLVENYSSCLDTKECKNVIMIDEYFLASILSYVLESDLNLNDTFSSMEHFFKLHKVVNEHYKKFKRSRKVLNLKFRTGKTKKYKKR